MLKDKIVLITGSSSGIGAAIAELALKYKAKVVLHGKTESEHLINRAKNMKAFFVASDVSNKSEVQASTKKIIDKFGKIDVLINCAGINKVKPFLETEDHDWLDIYKTNVLGIVHFCQAVIPHMKSSHYGRIVNIASIRACDEAASVRTMAYSSSKASVVNITAALAKECAPEIAVNAVSPGFVETDMSQTWNEVVWKQARSSLFGRTGYPEEIAEVALFLASNRASFITGQTIIADGGYLIAGK